MDNGGSSQKEESPSIPTSTTTISDRKTKEGKILQTAADGSHKTNSLLYRVLRSYCSRWSLGIKPLVWSIGYKRNDIWLDSLTTNYFPFLRKLSNWYPWHTECHGWSGDALRGVVSSHCGLSFFDNGDDLRRCHNLRRDGKMLKVACHKKRVLYA